MRSSVGARRVSQRGLSAMHIPTGALREFWILQRTTSRCSIQGFARPINRRLRGSARRQAGTCGKLCRACLSFRVGTNWRDSDCWRWSDGSPTGSHTSTTIRFPIAFVLASTILALPLLRYLRPFWAASDLYLFKNIILIYSKRSIIK